VAETVYFTTKRVKNKCEEQRNIWLQDMRQRGVERIENKNYEQRRMWLKDMPQREHRIMRLENERQRELQVITRNRVSEHVKNRSDETLR
jgi:hypothetical protein